jgi:hypothetical protein
MLPGSFNVEVFRELTKKIIAAEKVGFWSDWSEKEKEFYTAKNWRAFSQSRGYSEEEIADYQAWLDIRDLGESLGLNPLNLINDLAAKAALKNIELDKNSEIGLSSRITPNTCEVVLCLG